MNFTIDRVRQVLADKDPGLTGNLLVERLVGAHIDLVSKEEYAKIGSVVCPLLTLVLTYCFVFVPVHSLAITIFFFFWLSIEAHSFTPLKPLRYYIYG